VCRARDGAAELRIWRQQFFDAMQNVQRDALRCRGVVGGDVRAQRNKIVDGFGTPFELHAALGFRCSLRVSHESKAVSDAIERHAFAVLKGGDGADHAGACHSSMSRYCSLASAARKARLRPVLLASFCNRAFVP